MDVMVRLPCLKDRCCFLCKLFRAVAVGFKAFLLCCPHAYTPLSLRSEAGRGAYITETHTCAHSSSATRCPALIRETPCETLVLDNACSRPRRVSGRINRQKNEGNNPHRTDAWKAFKPMACLHSGEHGALAWWSPLTAVESKISQPSWQLGQHGTQSTFGKLSESCQKRSPSDAALSQIVRCKMTFYKQHNWRKLFSL